MGPPAGRRCPRCTFPLAVRTSPDGEVDVCPRCRGAFFDARECRSALGPHADVATWASSGFARPLRTGTRPCPDGHGPFRRWRIEVATRSSVDVEACDTCGGLWLDAGESLRLRRALAPSGAGVVPRPPAGRVSVRPLRFRRSAPRPDEPPEGEGKSGAGWYVFQLVTGMPLEVWNPVRALPVACLAILVVCALAFLVELSLAPATLRDVIRDWGAVPAAILRGEHLHSVLTHMFLHAGVLHVAGNLWFLWMFGDNVEDRIGRARLVALFLGSGLVGLAAHVALDAGSTMPVVGASAGVAGLMGAYLVLFPSVKLYTVLFLVRWTIPAWLFVGLWALTNVAGALAGGGNVAWVAHLGGLAAGLVWALGFGRRYSVAAAEAAAA